VSLEKNSTIKFYLGEFREGKPHGYGLLYYNDSTFYFGMFLDGVQHGYGVQVWDHQKFYKGFWARGRQNGFGRFYQPGKNCLFGLWEQGFRYEPFINENAHMSDEDIQIQAIEYKERFKNPSAKDEFEEQAKLIVEQEKNYDQNNNYDPLNYPISFGKNLMVVCERIKGHNLYPGDDVSKCLIAAFSMIRSVN
jgi:hypothetical protein